MKLSIIIPVFNNAETIERTIHSLFGHSANYIEVIFIDDGSTDESIQIIKKLFESNSMNYAIYHQTNSGVSSARNNGLRNANSDFILFLDADDSLHPDFSFSIDSGISFNNDLFIYQYESKKNNFVVSKGYGVNKKEGHFDIYDELEKYFFLKRDRMSFQISSIIFKREFLLENDISFDENLKSGEDSLFIFNAMICSKSIYNVPKILFCYIQTEGSITNSYNLRLLDSFISMTKLSKLFYEREMYKLSQLVNLKSALLLQLQLYKLKKRASHLSIKEFLGEVFSYYPNLANDLRNKVSYSRKGVKGLKLHLLWLEALVFSWIFGYLFRSAKP